MNAKYLIAALVALAGPACAFAQATPAQPEENRLPHKVAAATSEQVAPVRAPAASTQPAPKAAGQNVHVCQNEAECDAAPHRDFTVTRAQVLAELYRARAAGEIPETEADNDIGNALLRKRAK